MQVKYTKMEEPNDAGDDVSGKGTSGEEARSLKEEEVMMMAGEV